MIGGRAGAVKRLKRQRGVPGGPAGGARVAVRELDVTDERALVGVLSGAGCAVNGDTYYHILTVMGGCLRAGVPYVDLGGLFHMTRKQMELDAGFRKAGVAALLGLGAGPGG